MADERAGIRAFALGVAVAALGPPVLGVALASGLLPSDWFWLVAPFGMIPLTGPLVGVVVRARVVGRPAVAAALAVPAGLEAGWVVAILVSLPLDPSQDAALALFFALLSTVALPWWLGPVLVAMALAWFIVRRAR